MKGWGSGCLVQGTAAFGSQTSAGGFVGLFRQAVERMNRTSELILVSSQGLAVSEIFRPLSWTMKSSKSLVPAREQVTLGCTRGLACQGRIRKWFYLLEALGSSLKEQGRLMSGAFCIASTMLRLPLFVYRFCVDSIGSRRRGLLARQLAGCPGSSRTPGRLPGPPYGLQDGHQS